MALYMQAPCTLLDALSRIITTHVLCSIS